MNLISILKSVQNGLLKRVLTGAGLTLGTSAVILTALNTAINQFRNSLGGVSHELLGLAGLAGLDYFFSIVLGAVVARQVQLASKITVQRLK